MANVLVYSGPGVSTSALSHTLATLRRLLPSYDVQTVGARSLALDPWQSNTSLVVIPGGRDLPYVEQLSRADWHSSGLNNPSSSGRRADSAISHYVRQQGGSFLGICAGAYYASSHCSFELGDPDLEVDGSRPALAFFPGVCRGTVFPGFVYESDDGARVVDLVPATFNGDSVPYSLAAFCEPWSAHYNGGGAFLGAEEEDAITAGVQVLAYYPNEASRSLLWSNQAADPRSGLAAAVFCPAGAGRAVLFGVHPEFPLRPHSRPVRLTAAPKTLPGAKNLGSSFSSTLLDAERRRLRIMASALESLGLRVESDELKSSEEEAAPNVAEGPPVLPPSISTPPRLTPLVLISASQGGTSRLLDSLRSCSTMADTEGEVPASEQALLTVQAGNDLFRLHMADTSSITCVQTKCLQLDYRPFRVPSPVHPAQPDYRESTGDLEDDSEAEIDFHRIPKTVLCFPMSSAELEKNRPLSTSLAQINPYFDVLHFMKELDGRRIGLSELDLSTTPPPRWPGDVAPKLAELVMYGQVVTSTQTMLDKNYRLLTRLPTGFTCFATHQVSGRGRGGNAWISPRGCLQFSTVLHLPPSAAGKIVFIQYLAALAVVEAVRTGLGSAYREIGERIRIKWPNDIYAEVEPTAAATMKGTFTVGQRVFAKMGGVLVNSQYAGTEFALVVGCGINCTNDRPTTSLSDLIRSYNNNRKTAAAPPLDIVSQEQLAAAVLASFERLIDILLRADSFAPFVSLYRTAWLHSEQLVRVDSDASFAAGSPVGSEAKPIRARIVGIASDYGSLRAVVEADSELTSQDLACWGPSARYDARFIDLQPDGNSFDMLQNLIRRKT